LLAEEQGIEQGIEQGALEMARKMKKEGIDLLLISKVSGMTLQELEALAISS